MTTEVEALAGVDYSTWNTLTENQKEIAAKNHIPPKDVRDLVYSDEEQKEYKITDIRNGIESRRNTVYEIL